MAALATLIRRGVGAWVWVGSLAAVVTGGLVIWWRWRQPAGEGQHAFVWDHGVMTDLGTLGGTTSSPADIDDQGRIAGNAELADGRNHAVLWIPRR